MLATLLLASSLFSSSIFRWAPPSCWKPTITIQATRLWPGKVFVTSQGEALEFRRERGPSEESLKRRLVDQMELRIECFGLLCLLFLSTATTFIVSCEARSSRQFKSRSTRHSRSHQLKSLKRIDAYSSNPYYTGSPNSLPPYEEVMDPLSSPQNYPPYCIFPPLTPLPPSTTLPTPVVPMLTPPRPPTSPPPAPTYYNNPPVVTPNPPECPILSPPEFVPSPPAYVSSPPAYVPNPPSYIPNPPPSFNPSPPQYVPSPPVFVPGPIIFQPPVVYPPPSVPPPPFPRTIPGQWCVAKPTVPDPIIQEAMDYACGAGADCDSIQPNGSCFQPDTLIAHASYAFNSYWQRTKVAGGTCDFGGTAILITEDPSYDGCHFIIY